MNDQIPSKDHDPAIDAQRMMEQTAAYTGVGIPPGTSTWTWPRKPLSPAKAPSAATGKSGAKSAGKSHGKAHHGKAHSSKARPKKQAFPNLNYGFD